jgi:hypothetical protein
MDPYCHLIAAVATLKSKTALQAKIYGRNQ